MMWSPDLHIVALLDLYLGPMPEVSQLVRRQLLREKDVESIRQAIESAAKGAGPLEPPYTLWLSCSGLEFTDKPAALVSLVASGELQHALFDLTIGLRARSFQLNRYTEVHEVREMMEHFFVEFEELVGWGGNGNLWWDGISSERTSHQHWLTTRLRGEPRFIPILESWLSDNEDLQFWLDDYQNSSPIVNNPTSPDRVFSYNDGMAITEFAKVR